MRIFMSSGGGDVQVVDTLSRCLKRCGFDLYHYRDDTPGGSPRLAEVIQRKIAQAQAAIICLSDDALARSWVQDEIAWCRREEQRGGAGLRRIDYLQVGPLDPKRIMERGLLTGRAITDITDEARREQKLQELLGELGRLRWGRSARQMVATVVAMTAAEAQDLLAAGRGVDPARDFCAQVGVAWPGASPVDVLARYGDGPLEFRPFGQGATALEIAREAMEAANEHARSGRPPLLLRWVDPTEARSTRRALGDAMRDAEPRLLVVVDSLSLILDKYQMLLDRLMAGVSRDTQPMVWVPPFTHATGCLEDRALALIRNHGTIHEWFEDWRQVRRMDDAFDFTTPAGLRRHLADMLYQAAAQTKEPDTHAVQAMNDAIRDAPWREHESGASFRWSADSVQL